MSYIGNEPIVSATRTVTEVSATAGQTVFTANGGYTVGFIDVFVNGSKLTNSDFTATNGTTITLNEAAQASDIVRLEALGTFLTGNHVPLVGDSNITGNVNVSGNVGIGTTSPAVQLHVSRAGSNAVRVQNTAAGAYVELGRDSTSSYVEASGATSLQFWTNASERLRIDSSGRVTMPFQPAFMAFLSTNTSINSGVQAVSLNAEEFDIGNNFNPSNGRFTAPISGTYQFNAVVAVEATSSAITYLSAELRKNGSRYLLGGWNSKATSTTAYSNSSASYTVYLSAGDYIELGTEVSHAVILTGTSTNGTRLSGCLLG